MDPHLSSLPALAAIELDSIARAWRVLDAMIKRAPITPWQTRPISSGRFLILLRAQVAPLEEAYHEGLSCASSHIIDSVLLPHAHPELLDLLGEPPPPRLINALGLVETNSSTSAIRAADAALKGAQVSLVYLHLGQGIAGKGLFALNGELHDIQAALEVAATAARPEHLLFTEQIPAPHGATTAQLLQMASLAPPY